MPQRKPTAMGWGQKDLEASFGSQGAPKDQGDRRESARREVKATLAGGFGVNPVSGQPVSHDRTVLDADAAIQTFQADMQLCNESYEILIGADIPRELAIVVVRGACNDVAVLSQSLLASGMAQDQVEAITARIGKGKNTALQVYLASMGVDDITALSAFWGWPLSKKPRITARVHTSAVSPSVGPVVDVQPGLDSIVIADESLVVERRAPTPEEDPTDAIFPKLLTRRKMAIVLLGLGVAALGAYGVSQIDSHSTTTQQQPSRR